MPAEATSTPRRLDADSRREQLVQVALAVTAERGYAGLTLEVVAELAGVTRAALYRYFPRGKHDLFLSAVERAGELLTADLVTDESLSLEERRARNFSMFIEHALEPQRRLAGEHAGGLRPAGDRRTRHRRHRRRVVETMAMNHFGTKSPGPYAEVGLHAYLAFAEAAFDGARERGLDRDGLFELLDAGAQRDGRDGARARRLSLGRWTKSVAPGRLERKDVRRQGVQPLTGTQQRRRPPWNRAPTPTRS